MEIDAPVNKVVVVILIASVFPIALTAFNGMNMTGFTTTQIALSGLMGLMIAFGFLKLIMKE